MIAVWPDQKQGINFFISLALLAPHAIGQLPDQQAAARCSPAGDEASATLTLRATLRRFVYFSSKIGTCFDILTLEN
jgi:hypothetical protein